MTLDQVLTWIDRLEADTNRLNRTNMVLDDIEDEDMETLEAENARVCARLKRDVVKWYRESVKAP